MPYSIMKCGKVRSSTAAVTTLTGFERHGAVVTVRLIPISPTAQASANIFIRTAAGVIVPLATECRISPSSPYQLKGIYLDGNQSLVIQPLSGNLDWIVDGFGQASPTATDLPQGRMFSNFGQKAAGNNFITLEVPEFGKRPGDSVEADIFLNCVTNDPIRVDVKASNTLVATDTDFNSPGAMWLFTTTLTGSVPTRIVRKIVFGYKYISFKCYGEGVSAFAQCNVKDHTLI